MSLAASFTPDFSQIVFRKLLVAWTYQRRLWGGKWYLSIYLGIPGGSAVKKKKFLWCRWCGFDPWVGKIPWRRKRQPTPVFLPGKILWSQKPGGLCPWGHKESDRTEHACIYLSIQPSIYPSIHVSIHLPLYLSPIYLPIHPSTCPSSRYYIPLPIQPFTNFLSCIFL